MPSWSRIPKDKVNGYRWREVFTVATKIMITLLCTRTLIRIPKYQVPRVLQEFGCPPHVDPHLHVCVHPRLGQSQKSNPFSSQVSSNWRVEADVLTLQKVKNPRSQPFNMWFPNPLGNNVGYYAESLILSSEKRRWRLMFGESAKGKGILRV